jgi:MoaA/NifB/PqqE/SkfB family radical SAM enzyme
MFHGMTRELHYQYRSLRLMGGFFAHRFIHCNLQVTYRCNFQCAICDFWKEKHEAAAELTVAQIGEIGRKLNSLGTLIVSLAGGEPLIREDVVPIIDAVRRANHFPILITNGWFVTETLARDMFRAGLQEVSVSIDYRDPAKHDAQRGRAGAWEQGIRALEMFNRARPDPRRRVHMISVLMDDNLADVEPLIHLSRDLGVTYMVNLHSWNRGTKERRTPDSKVTVQLLDLKARYPEFVTLTTYIERLDEAVEKGGIGDCQAGKLLLNISPQGDVARCTETLDEPIGNILTEDIGELRSRLRDVQARRPCAQCWTSCRGFAESMYARPRRRQFREFYRSVKGHG